MALSLDDARLTSRLALPPAGWRPALAGIGVLLALALALFGETYWSMVAKWYASETYAHGFVIVPISLWLIWRRADVLERLAPRPDPLALLALAALGAIWLVGELAAVGLARQYAVTAMVPGLVWLLGGRALLRAWLFPLAFLLLAVPVGGFLVPPLMELTADITIPLVRLSGVPVYREGLYFYLPTGSWLVAEACSGIRYLIAAFTLGLLYAYLQYHSLGRRLAFVAASILVPIIANGLRAYGIVMLGHLSEMRIAVGVDHLIYGWLFFGLVMLALFWVGRIWQEEEPRAPTARAQPAGTGGAAPRPNRLAGFALAGAAVLALWPAWAGVLDRQSVPVAGALQLPEQLAGAPALPAVPESLDWSPSLSAADAEARAAYGNAHDGQALLLFVGLYRHQRENHELIAYENALVPRGRENLPGWKLIGRQGSASVPRPGGGVMEAPLYHLRDRGQHLLVARWYWSAGESLAAPWRVRVNTAAARLLGDPAPGAYVAVARAWEPGEPAELAPRETLAEIAAQAARSAGQAIHE